MIFIIVSLIVILFVLSIWFRKQITGLTGTVKDYAIGNWYRAYPIFRKALIFGGVGWLILIVLMIGIGAYANSITAALIISILFPFWFVSMLIPRRTVPSPAKWRIPIFGIIRVFGGIVLIIASISLAIGLWSPDTKGALNERSDDSKVWTTNFFKKGSVHSERNAGVRGRVKSATGVYDDFRKQIKNKIVPAGKIIMILDFKSKPATEDSEALSLVMLSNEHENFVNGEKVWMPTLKIEFISNEEQETKSEPPANVPAASAPNNWKLCWQKPEGYTGLTQTKSRCDTVEVKFIEQGFRLEIAGGMFSVTGERVDENVYEGTFQNKAGGGGDIFLKFSPDFKLATGWQKDSGSQEEVYTWLTR